MSTTEGMWVSTMERLPKKEDADKDGNILAIKLGRVMLGKYNEVTPTNTSSWMKIPQVPIQNEEELTVEQLQAIVDCHGKHDCIGGNCPVSEICLRDSNGNDIAYLSAKTALKVLNEIKKIKGIST